MYALGTWYGVLISHFRGKFALKIAYLGLNTGLSFKRGSTVFIMGQSCFPDTKIFVCFCHPFSGLMCDLLWSDPQMLVSVCLCNILACYCTYTTM